jgi:1,4-dihydroxy-2-naphthoate octaprenyltransferase
LIAVAWGAPPFRLALTGYGEVLLAAGLSLLVPALAFSLQAATWHRLLGMVGVPLFTMSLAAALAWDFPNYAAHLREGRRTLLMRLDWRTAMRLHNLAWLTGFLLLALDVALGLPWDVAAPCGIAFLAALMQVWMMHRVGKGARPPWKWLRANAVLTLALTAYFLAVGFWHL